MFDTYMQDYAYPCITYVIRRLGIIGYSAEAIARIPGMRYDSGKSLAKGDILVWKSDSKETSLHPLTVAGNKIVSVPIITNVRFAVYEGEDIVSDCVIVSGYIPTIRMYKLSSCKEDPTYIIRDFR